MDTLARAAAAMEKCDGTGLTIARVHDDSVNHARTVWSWSRRRAR